MDDGEELITDINIFSKKRYMMDVIELAKNNFQKGIDLYSKKKYLEAIDYFKKTLEYAPESIPTLENLSKTYIKIKQYDKAEKVLLKLISLNKEGNEIGYELLLYTYIDQNEYSKLKDLQKHALKKKKYNPKNQIRSKIFYPNFFNSEDEIQETREKFNQEIDSLISDEKLPKLSLSSSLLKPINFELSYDGKDNLLINTKLTKLYKKIYPEIESFKIDTSKKNEKITIGFISEFFTDHTIMKLFRGIIYKIDKNIFDIFVFHSNKTLPGKKFQEINENEALHKHKNFILPKEFKEKVDLIASKNLDILFYPDIHMSTDLFYLTFIKLAKYQFTSWGHPETTGNDNIDYFLSSNLLEVEGYKNRYSEKVILSDYLPMYFYKPKVISQILGDQLSNKKIYFCPQTLIKMHPSFDEAIKKILYEDRKGQIIFIQDGNKVLNKLFFERLKKKIPEGIERVKFIERLTVEEYINYCGSSSVILDPFWFGAGNSFHESMFYGTPTVTMPTEYLKSRIVTGAYKQMKIENPPVTDNLEDYVSKCVDLANSDNNELKKYYRHQADSYLYENKNEIPELENIFKSLINC